MNPLAEIIRREIAAAGAMPFARFMELALYCPKLGYYERKPDAIGQRGDYHTSVSVGPLFGELLAFQFAEWLEELPDPHPSHAPLKIVEAGAHDGKLAADILAWLQHRRRKIFDRIEYHIIEPSELRRQWQAERLSGFAGKVKWADQTRYLWREWKGGYEPLLAGIMFSNELLDALPADRMGWNAKAKKWFEWGVTYNGERFVWHKTLCRPSDNRIPKLPESLLAVLPDDYTVESGLRIENEWWRMAYPLRRGKLLTIDYGLSAQELFMPERVNGTLRAYHRHQVSDDLLAHPGEQDLTAHVNFTAVQATGEWWGLKTERLCSQAQFLTDILRHASLPPRSTVDGSEASPPEKYFIDLTAAQVRQFQTLTHPDHFGRAFRVLVQSRTP